MGFYGMDTEQGEQFAQLLGERKVTIEDRAAQLDGVIGRIDSFWRGPDAETFRVDWEQLRSTHLRDAVERLLDLGRDRSDHAHENDIASAQGLGALGGVAGYVCQFDGRRE